MRRELVVKGRTLGSSADLTLLAPLKRGFVESLESVTYKTRTKRVLEALHGARIASHEHHAAQLLSDAVERVAAIHSVRVAVLEPEDNVLLAVTFDGPWQSYIRTLWDKVGALLDLVFCGTQDYVLSATSRFDEWLQWAHRVQVETGFFYGPPGHSARDAWYWQRVDRMRALPRASMDPKQALVDELHAVLPSAEEAAQRIINPLDKPSADEPQIRPQTAHRLVRECVRSGMQGLAALYRLTDLHRPGTPDGDVLRRAALQLLHEFVRLRDDRLITDELQDEYEGRFARQLDWLFPSLDKAILPRTGPPLPATQELPDALRREVQAGVLRTFPDVTHGAVVMLAFDSPAAAASFGRWCNSNVTFDIDVDPNTDQPGVVFRSVAFTPAGLLAAGLGEEALAAWPEEFRQGMAARAGLLGDVRNNHPRRWRLPVPYGGTGGSADRVHVEMEAVHAVVQLRILENAKAPGAEKTLSTEIAALHAPGRGQRVLAVQPLLRRYKDHPDRGRQITEHFGYADGEGQPDLEWPRKKEDFERNHVHLGEVLVGHPNAAEEPRDPDDPHLSSLQSQALRWQANGSFLVMRKYRQFVSRLELAVKRTAEQLLSDNQDLSRAQCEDIVYGRMMGRTREGMPLVPLDKAGGINRFTYDQDADGTQCPLHAHVRRANPRFRADEMARPARLVRRSMSYGPPREQDKDGAPEAERGLVFMAYNASLSEQFEVVQRWLAGGNSTGSSSAASCPIVGVSENGLARHFRFDYCGKLYEVRLEHGDEKAAEFETQPQLFDEPPAITRLEWGLYLFAPARATFALIEQAAHAAAVEPQRLVPWELARGRELLAALRRVEIEQGRDAALDAWKAALEDPDAIDRLDSAALWAAIREDEAGVLDTPFGVLAARQEVVAQLYLDSPRRLSVCGQLERMRNSFGEIALGMDDTPEYQRLQKMINEAIRDLDLDEVFEVARDAATRYLESTTKTAIAQALKAGDARFEVGFDARQVLDEVLADLSEHWFGLHDEAAKPFFNRGSTDWNWQPGQPPLYPGHFMPLSRYMFQPNPGCMARELGQRYGQALRVAMRGFVDALRNAKRVPAGRRSQPALLMSAILHDANLAAGDMAARTAVGVLMGFNPTITGAVLNVLREWWRDGLLAQMRTQLFGVTTYAVAYDRAYEPMRRAAQMRPMPQLGWRTALADHDIVRPDGKPVHVAAGRKVVLGIVSGTQQALARDEGDADRLMFGGERWTNGAHPVHACPGYDQGIAAMLGALAGMLGFVGSNGTPTLLRPGASPLAFLLEGPTPQQPAPKQSKDFKPAPADAAPRRRAQRNGQLIMAWGDSWLDRSLDGILDVGADLRDCLDVEHGYDVPEKFCKWSRWPKLETMAADPEPFMADLEAALISARKPVAVLLSGGGNDSTRRTLEGLLNVKQNGVPVVNDAALRAHIARLRGHYAMLISRISHLLDAQEQKDTPIITHGYDNPVPRGRSIPGPLGIELTYARVWMLEPFENKKYKCDPERDATDLDAARGAMKALIEALNEMHKSLANEFSRVRYVDLRGIISPKIPSDAQQTDDVDWADDLHPTNGPFKLMAEKISKEIKPLGT